MAKRIALFLWALEGLFICAACTTKPLVTVSATSTFPTISILVLTPTTPPSTPPTYTPLSSPTAKATFLPSETPSPTNTSIPTERPLAPRLFRSPDGKTLLVAIGEELYIFDASLLKVVGAIHLNLKLTTHEIYTAYFSSDGTLVALAEGMYWAHVVDLVNQEVVATLLSRAPDWIYGSVNAVIFTPDKQYVVYRSSDSSMNYGDDAIILWDIVNDKRVRIFPVLPEDKRGQMTEPTISSDGNLVVAVRNSKVIYVWDLSTGAIRATFGVVNVVKITFSTDGKTLTSEDINGVEQQWQLPVDD